MPFRIIASFSGVMWPPLHQISADGYDLQFATNVMGTVFKYFATNSNYSYLQLGHFLLTHLLLGNLKAGAKSLPEKKSRIINTSSGTIYLTHRINWDTLVDGPKRRGSSTEALYYQSKFVCLCPSSACLYGHNLVIRQTSYSQTNSQGDTETTGSSRYR